MTFCDLKQEHEEFGRDLLMKLKESGMSAKESSSADGKTLIQNNMDNLEKEFREVFSGIDRTIHEISRTQTELRNFKSEFEQVNEWLQGMEQEIRQERSECRASSLHQKQENVANCQRLLDEFNRFRDTEIRQLGQKEFLLKSHLEGYARSQLMIVDSRFQVLMNLLTEVTVKAKSIAEHHQQFKEKVDTAGNYIHVSTEMLCDLEVQGADGSRRTRADLESGITLCKDLQRRNQEEGQQLVYTVCSIYLLAFK